MTDDQEAIFERHAAETVRDKEEEQQDQARRKKWEVVAALLSQIQNPSGNSLAGQLGREPTRCEFFDWYAGLLIQYCRAVRDADPAAALPDLTPGSDDSRLALDVLRSAWREDSGEIVRILQRTEATGSNALGGDLAASLIDLLHRMRGTKAPLPGNWVNADPAPGEPETAEGAAPDLGGTDAGGIDCGMLVTALQQADANAAGSEAWVFAPSGNGYDIAVPEGKGHFGELKGFGQIYQLISSTNGTVPMRLLIGGADDARLCADRRSRQPAIGAEGFQQIAEKRRELKADLEKATKDNNPSEADRLQAELIEFNAAVSASMALGETPRDLNSDRGRHRASIHASLNRAYKALRDGKPPLNELAKHFELSISCEGACFVYKPERRPPWRFGSPGQM
jgi:hypothetical protein